MAASLLRSWWLPVLGIAFSACFLDVPALEGPGGGGAGGAAPSGGAGGDPAGGGGGGACPTGLADCDTDGACETDLTSDPNNCAVCERSCGLSPCLSSLCNPKPLGPPVDFPHHVALRGALLFYTFGGSRFGTGGVQRISASGGGHRRLVHDAPSPAGLAPYTDETGQRWIYWADGSNGALHRVNEEAFEEDFANPVIGELEVIFAGVAGSEPIAGGEAGVTVDGDVVYWTFGRGGRVYAANIDDDHDRTDLAAGEVDPTQIAVLGDHVYWTGDFAGLRRIAKDALGDVEAISSPDAGPDDRGFGLLVHDGALYWRESNPDDDRSGRIVRYDPEDPRRAAATLVDSPGARGIATDGTFLFWVGNVDATVWRADVDGSNVLLLAQEPHERPTGIAAGAERPNEVYWTNFDVQEGNLGGLFSVAK